MSDKKPTVLRRLLRIEPGISLGQWAYDRVTNNAGLLTSAFGGAVMYALGLITDWARAVGPMGIGGVAIAATLAIWIGLSAAQNQRAKAAVRKAEAAAITKWKEEVDTINPLEK